MRAFTLISVIHAEWCELPLSLRVRCSLKASIHPWRASGQGAACLPQARCPLLLSAAPCLAAFRFNFLLRPAPLPFWSLGFGILRVGLWFLFLQVGKMTRRGSCQCRLVAVLSVREESEVTLPYFSLELEAGGSGATRESLERSAFAPQPQSGVHQEDTELTQNPHSFLGEAPKTSLCHCDDV